MNCVNSNCIYPHTKIRKMILQKPNSERVLRKSWNGTKSFERPSRAKLESRVAEDTLGSTVSRWGGHTHCSVAAGTPQERRESERERMVLTSPAALFLCLSLSLRRNDNNLNLTFLPLLLFILPTLFLLSFSTHSFYPASFSISASFFYLSFFLLLLLFVSFVWISLDRSSYIVHSISFSLCLLSFPLILRLPATTKTHFSSVC